MPCSTAAEAPISPELLETVRAARREKIMNKMHEKMCERRGEILPRTLKRARKGPQPHVLMHMPAERHMEKVVRGVGEVGYVGMIKRRIGFKLRDGGKGLARENETDLEGERLERLRKMDTLLDGRQEANEAERKRGCGEKAVNDEQSYLLLQQSSNLNMNSLSHCWFSGR
ncbi:hypothetical protein FB451DRAFT_1212676 [Mycena latifolia]|nr:hypothetical protein FB451DRAFT_1212676 [Mycena latifolia]